LAGIALIAAALPSSASGAYSAAEVVGYAAGSGTQVSLRNPASALGLPAPQVPGSFGYGPQVLNPYTPHFEGTNIVQIGVGGEITLRLERFVTVSPTERELGVWESVFLVNGSNPAAVSGADSAEVFASENGIDFFSVGTHSFSWFGNYWLDASGPNDLDNSQPADFGQPFVGSLSAFDGVSYAGAVAALGGSGGGTWIDLDASGLSRVGWIRFANVPAGTLELDAVAINTSLAGTSTIPEPSGATLALVSLFLAYAHSRTRLHAH
jgi:hypothetical protein